MIDSEPVPWGKGEKNPDEGSEIELKPYAYKEPEPDHRKVGWVTVCLLKNDPTSLSKLLSISPLKDEWVGKPSVNSAF